MFKPLIIGYKYEQTYYLHKTDVYMSAGNEPTAARFFCTLASLPTAVRAYGPIYDKNGNEVDIDQLIRKHL